MSDSPLERLAAELEKQLDGCVRIGAPSIGDNWYEFLMSPSEAQLVIKSLRSEIEAQPNAAERNEDVDTGRGHPEVQDNLPRSAAPFGDKSETPRTDNVASQCVGTGSPMSYVRAIDLCRQLERELNAARSAIGRRVLLEKDSYCPACGHNRDTSAVSSIDNEDGTNSCQLCNANWIEISATDSGSDK